MVESMIKKAIEWIVDDMGACIFWRKGLAEYLNQPEERPRLRKMIENMIKEVIEWTVDASIMCCTQIDSSKFYRFFPTLVNKGGLDKFGQHDMYKQITIHLDVSVMSVKEDNKLRRYPENAVGIEESVKEVIDLLEWGSEKNVAAVILHGFGGMGKITYANAVFSQTDIQGCKYSMM